MLHCPNFAGSSRSTGISQLRAGKTLSKRARSHFSSTRRLFPYVYRPSHLFRPITISLFVFKLEFHEFPFQFGKRFCRPAAASILMPRTLPIASLNHYTPKFSGVAQKLTWCQQFGLQIFQKNAFF